MDYNKLPPTVELAAIYLEERGKASADAAQKLARDWFAIMESRRWQTNGKRIKAWAGSLNRWACHAIKEAEASAKRPPFVAPSIEAVAAFAAEHGCEVDAERFVEYYSERDWRYGTSGDQITRWRQVVISWHDREKRQQDETAKYRAKREAAAEADRQ